MAAAVAADSKIDNLRDLVAKLGEIRSQRHEGPARQARGAQAQRRPRHHHGLHRPQLVFSSSTTVYGWPEEVPCTEEFPLSATNPYSRTKLVIEDICHDLQCSDHDLQCHDLLPELASCHC